MGCMRVVMVSKALVVGAYQRKAEEIARLGVELTVLVPPAWGDRRGRQTAAPVHVDGYDFEVAPIRFGGNFHLHYYPRLARRLAEIRPDLLHMDEEPYNLATYLGVAAAARQGIPALFFTWQNLYRRYPPPFAWMEQANYKRAALALAGSEDAAAVLRRKGYAGPLAVIPQFGVDPNHFSPRTWAGPPADTLCIGYAGGLLREKGVDLLLAACAGLRGGWRLQIVGEGDARDALQAQARDLGIASQVVIGARLPSEEMPAFYRDLDVLVLPSRTTATWVEQFGRVLIEAMACAVPVVGSASGEIAQVVGDAGLLFAEGDVVGLRGCLQRLIDEPDLRVELAERGRARVLERYTMGQIAKETVSAYQRILDFGF